MEKKTKAEFAGLVREALITRGHQSVGQVNIHATKPTLQVTILNETGAQHPAADKPLIDDVLREMEQLYTVDE